MVSRASVVPEPELGKLECNKPPAASMDLLTESKRPNGPNSGEKLKTKNKRMTRAEAA